MKKRGEIIKEKKKERKSAEQVVIISAIQMAQIYIYVYIYTGLEIVIFSIFRPMHL